jgi:hypothetical protein
MWITFTVLAAVGLAALVIVFGWAPQNERMAEANSATALVETENEQLENELRELEAQAQNLPQYEAELASLRGQFPTSLELASFTRYLSGLADQADLRVTAIGVSPPVLVTEVPEFPDAPDGTRAPGVPAPVEGLYMYAISMSVEAPLAQAADFVEALQGEAQDTRMFLASEVSWSIKEDGSAGNPEDGESGQTVIQEFSIQGLTFALIPADQLQRLEEEETEAPEGGEEPVQ